MMSSAIDQYLQSLATKLDLTNAERAAVLEEMRAHLEEYAANLQASGADAQEAEQAAVNAFGEAGVVARHIAFAHPTPWGWRRLIGGLALGGVAFWAVRFLGSFPVLAYLVYHDAAIHPLNIGQEPSLVTVLLDTEPLTTGGWNAYLAAGWPWLALLTVIFLALPFTWGMRARSWWGPGLAYGLGAWIGAPWFITYLFIGNTFSLIGNAFSLIQPEAQLIVSLAPLAVVASGLGALVARLWQPRLAQLASA